MSEAEIFISNFIVLNFNSGAWTINLSNRDVRGEVRYVPANHSAVVQAESGLSHSQWIPQAEYFEFVLRYDTPASRNRFEKIRELISTNYTLAITINHFYGPFADFNLNPNIADTTSNQKFQATFSAAVIEIPEDTGIDVLKRGKGVVADQEITLRVYRSVSLPVPASTCDQVTVNDFDVTWRTSGTNGEDLDGIEIAVGSGLVASVDNASGTDPEMTDTAASFTEVWSWSVGNSRFETTAPGTFTMIDGTTYVFSVTLPIVLTDGTNCSYDLEVSYSYSNPNDTPPTASSVAVTGTTTTGSTLTASYTYADVDSDLEGDSALSWWRYTSYTDEKNNSGGVQIKSGIPSTSGILSYVATSSDVGYYIVFKVLPIAATGQNPVGTVIGARTASTIT